MAHNNAVREPHDDDQKISVSQADSDDVFAAIPV